MYSQRKEARELSYKQSLIEMLKVVVGYRAPL